MMKLIPIDWAFIGNVSLLLISTVFEMMCIIFLGLLLGSVFVLLLMAFDYACHYVLEKINEGLPDE